MKMNKLLNKLIVCLIAGTPLIATAASNEDIRKPDWPISANHASSWPVEWPKLGSDYWEEFDEKIFKCSDADYPNPNFGNPRFLLAYNLIINATNVNSKMRYDVYSSAEHLYIQKNVKINSGKNIISILPNFIDSPQFLTDGSAKYIIVFKGMNYKGIDVNLRTELDFNISNAGVRGCQNRNSQDNDGHLDCSTRFSENLSYLAKYIFYPQAKLKTTFTASQSIARITSVNPDFSLSKYIDAGSARSNSCINYLTRGAVYIHAIQLFASVDGYQIDLNGTLNNYVNPDLNPSSPTYYHGVVEYDLRRMLWQNKSN